MEERMPLIYTRAFLKSALVVALAGGTCSLILLSSARAQESGASQNPANSTTEHETTPPPAKPSEGDTETRIRVQTNMVTAPVTVINSKGEYVFDLQERDFEVLDNDVRQHIEQFSLEQRTLEAVLVVQTNSTSEPLLEEVRPLGPVFSGLMIGPQGEAAVVTYGDQIRVIQDFTQDGDKLESVLRGLEARGGSDHLNDALERAIAMLETRPKENRRIIVAFSDGHDLGSKTHKEEIVQRAVNSGITIYGLGFSPTRAMLARQPKTPPPNPVYINMGVPAPPGQAPLPSNVEKTYEAPSLPVVDLVIETGEVIHSIVAKNALEFYAGYTGGVCYGSWTKQPLQDELNRISSEIQSQYEIAYVPHAPSVNGFHRIEVHVDRRGVKVRTRAGYFLGGTGP
jgi:VWFA-related protein